MTNKIVFLITLALVVFAVPLTTGVTTVYAQAAPPDCTGAIQAILTAVAGTCADLAEGEACLAHEAVTLESIDPAKTAALTQADDRASLSGGQTLHTSAYDPATGAWGVALLQPLTNPAPVWLLMTGDVQLAYQSRTDLHVLTNTAIDLACSAEQPGLTLYTPGQHILTLNRAAITVESALAVIWQPTRNSLAFAVHQGQLSVADGPVAGAGQTLIAVTDNDGNVIFWSAPRAHYPEETQHAGITTQALNALIGTSLAASAPASVCQPRTHIVQQGEWVHSIARQYDVSAAAIIAANNLQDPNRLYAGQQLTIPCHGTPTQAQPGQDQPGTLCANNPTHRVTQGETLFRIALRYGVTVDAVVAANNLPNPRLIYVGQELVIPCGVDSGISSVAPAQPGDSTPAQPPNTGSPATFCQQDWGAIPFDVQQFIDQICVQ